MPKRFEVLLVLLSAVALDTLWTIWISAVAHGMMFLASIVSMSTGALSLVGVSTLLKKNYLIVVWLVGLGMGTALAMTVCPRLGL
jgi:hypothetical protein